MHDFNDPVMPGGIVGNGRMLCSIRPNGALHRLFWPHIDWGQHMGILKVGIQEQENQVFWLDSSEIQYPQLYQGDTNIFTTIIERPPEGMEISQTDFVLPDRDVLVRCYTLRNTGPVPRSYKIITYCSFSINESEIQDCMYYLPSQQALIQFRLGVFLGLKSPGREPTGFHCGRRNSPSDPFIGLSKGEFWGNPDNIKSGAGGLGWETGAVEPGGLTCLSLVLAAANSEGSLTGLLSDPRLNDTDSLAEQVGRHWECWLNQQKSRPSRPETALYKRSLLAMKLMSDRTSGASVAAPEFDAYYTASGGYGYCWPRDGMFVALALDEARYHHEAGMFYRFAAGVQNQDGSWHQRYFMNGQWAPTWGRQIDQVGSVLWGYCHHFKLTGDESFLNEIWPSVYSAAGYLLQNRIGNGLQIPAMDIWEDDFAQNTYASASIYGGLKGAAALASVIGDTAARELWDEAAGSLKNSIILHQWSQKLKTFTKSVNRRVCEWDYCRAVENGEEVYEISLPGTPFRYQAVARDSRLDISILGLCYPFGVLEPGDPLMEASAAMIEERLLNHSVGGIHRYEGDTYAGGNPWVLATLWMSIFKSLQGNRDKALEYLTWAEANSSPAGLLPEQVHREKGGPAWVLPLNWSHAMYVLASLALTCGLSAENTLY